jgi:Protein of unknown function, DUF255
MTNQLSQSASPYLLQHKNNPVHWQEWSAAAFVEARERDVPVLLSIGYSACHWCHVSVAALRIGLKAAKLQVRGTISVHIRSSSFAL